MNPTKNLGFGITIAVVVVVMSANIGANPLDFISGVPNLLIVAEEMANVDSSLLDTAFWAMLETLQMAFIGTVVGVVIGLPLSLLSSRNISSKWIYVPIRSLLAAIRTSLFNRSLKMAACTVCYTSRICITSFRSCTVHV